MCTVRFCPLLSHFPCHAPSCSVVGGTVIGVGVFGILLALWLYKNPYAGCAKCLITIHVLAAFIFFALFGKYGLSFLKAYDSHRAGCTLNVPAVVGIASFLVNGYLKDHASVLDEVIQVCSTPVNKRSISFVSIRQIPIPCLSPPASTAAIHRLRTPNRSARIT